MNKVIFSLKVILLLLLIQGCSGNGFHLRKNVELSPQYSKLILQGLSSDSEFTPIFADALSEAGGTVVNDQINAISELVFSKFVEGRRVIAYTSARRAREYLVYLKVEYSIRLKNKKNVTDEELPKWRINIDRSYLYDPDFALGKAEEEEKVKRALYEEATRLILLRLKYSKKT
ncbi:MAG: outer membrane lipopolysaccharide assembly protein LptE/RlpB [Cocleimonas sp.]|jgi:outer membrane lipopolysaccharide assembly protein LptE/RlpB